MSRKRNINNKVFKALIVHKKKKIKTTTHYLGYNTIARNERKNLRKASWKNYFIRTTEGTVPTPNQLEACRKVISRIVRRYRRKAKLVTCPKFTIACTAKSKNARMGKGKGGVTSYIASLKAFDLLSIIPNVPYICAAHSGAQIKKKLNLGVCVDSLIIRQNGIKSR